MTIIDNDTQQPVDEPPREAETVTIPPEPPIDPAVAAEVRQAREMIPVGAAGAAPMNLAQQVDFAKTMMRAVASLPLHLRENVGDCLAIVDIASRHNLSPYMLANKTYVQGGRLCFESQAYHALAQSSGLLQGDLVPEWIGEGDERQCRVTGYLRNDPKPRVYTGPKLKDVHPGRVTKNGSTFVKGSQLWDDKPDVQLFYDASRDWIRMFAPRATLGIYIPEEIARYQDTPQTTEQQTATSLKERLAAADRSEGHQPGKVEQELAAIAPAATTIKPAKKERKQPAAPADQPAKAADDKGAEEARPRRRLRRRRAAEPEQQTQATTAPPQDQAQEAAAPPAEQAQAEPPTKSGPPTTAAEYQAHAIAWIDRIDDPDDLEARWEGEDELRNQLCVPVVVRIALRQRINAKTGRN